MMRGKLYINGLDAYMNWGVYLGNGSLNALLTPPPSKEMVSNSCRLLPGDQVVDKELCLGSRDVSLIFHIKASGYDDFTVKLDAFLSEICKGIIRLRTKFQPDTTYRLRYVSSTSLTQLYGEIGTVAMKFNEPNPKDRSNNG